MASTKLYNEILMARRETIMGHFKMYYAINGDKIVKSSEPEHGLDIESALETLKKHQKSKPPAVNKEGVHRTHCCVAHGCKYGDRNCPVETGRIQQDYTCEYCDHDGIDNLDDLKNHVTRSMNDKEPLISEENYIKLYGTEPATDVTEKVLVSLELLQKVWLELFNNPPEENMVEYQNTIDEVITLLDKHDALPELEDD